jgi:hypothetical protein
VAVHAPFVTVLHTLFTLRLKGALLYGTSEIAAPVTLYRKNGSKVSQQNPFLISFFWNRFGSGEPFVYVLFRFDESRTRVILVAIWEKNTSCRSIHT